MSTCLMAKDFSSHGSGHGWSYYSDLVACPLRISLDGNRIEPSIEDIVGELNRGGQRIVGVVFHKLLERYHGGTSKQCSIDEVVLTTTAMREALRVFTEYKKWRSPEYFGKVWEVEHQLPATEEQKQSVRRFFGGCDVTARIDMVSEDARGLWIVDHKTVSWRRSKIDEEFRASGQFDLYVILWNLCYPDRPIVGTKVNLIVCHKVLKEESFEVLEIPIPTSQRIESVKSFIGVGSKLGGTSTPVRSSCWDKYGACRNMQICPVFS